jgi:hypothetical protein
MISYEILGGKPEGRRPFGRLDVDRRIILNGFILGKYMSWWGLA